MEPSPLGGSGKSTVLGKLGPGTQRLLRETGILLRPGALRIRIIGVGYCPDKDAHRKD